MPEVDKYFPNIFEDSPYKKHFDEIDKHKNEIIKYTKTLYAYVIYKYIYCYALHGIKIIPSFGSETYFSEVFPSGDTKSYQPIMNNLPIVSDKTSWKQILQFREDKNSVLKFRSLKKWFEESLAAKSESQATDIISKKIEDYEWAIKKHGLKTITGGFSNVLGWNAITAAGVGVLVEQISKQPIWSMIITGTIFSSRIIVWITDRLIDLKDIKLGKNAEIAYIYEANKKFRKSK